MSNNNGSYYHISSASFVAGPISFTTWSTNYGGGGAGGGGVTYTLTSSVWASSSFATTASFTLGGGAGGGGNGGASYHWDMTLFQCPNCRNEYPQRSNAYQAFYLTKRQTSLTEETFECGWCGEEYRHKRKTISDTWSRLTPIP